MKLEKAFRFYQKRNNYDIIINSKGSIQRIAVTNISYIEKDRDDLIFHTIEGDFSERGSIKAMKEKLSELPFSECTSGCLVNLENVKRVEKDIITLNNGTKLPLSRRNKKQFTQEYITYVGGGY
ncbi:MAG: LytTR family DNA-binding domain-containing protein [Lachnospiraceae bacterium]|nr:LytTR family DNA-binding domain-containing protein [Lachnospiraceae bacterium]MDD3615204.1 LytTR family DNA-binding domain-containing protein [Lachnospiraceae bacterium]